MLASSMAIKMLSIPVSLLLLLAQQTACLPGSSHASSSSGVLQESNTHNALSTASVFPKTSSNTASFTSSTAQPSLTSSDSSAPPAISSSGVSKSPKPGSNTPSVPSETSTTGTPGAWSSETSSTEAQGSTTTGVQSSSSSPLPTFTTQPEGFSVSSLTSLGTENTLLTTMKDGHQTILPVFHGQALYGVNTKGTYFNLPGISGAVDIPCIIGCSNEEAPAPAGGGSSGPPDTSNDPNDDNDNENDSTTSSSESCTSSSTQTLYPETVLCAVISTGIQSSEASTTTCSTSTKTSTTVGCDITATGETSTSTVTPKSTTSIPLTMEVYTVYPPSSTPTSTPASSRASSSMSTSTTPKSTTSVPLTMEVYTVYPASSSPTSTPTSSPASSTPKSTTSIPLTMEVYTVLPPSSSPASTPTRSSSSSSITPTPTTPPTTTAAPSITCIPNGKPSLVCQCTESGTRTFTAPALSNTADFCGYTAMPSSTISITPSPEPTFTSYTWTDPIESIVKSCETATTVSSYHWTQTTCDDPVPISTLHPQSGTATLHVWEAWQTDSVSAKVFVAAVMNDTDQVMVADQREAVEVRLGENVTIPVTNLEQYPINIEPVAGVEYLDDSERRRRRSSSSSSSAELDKRIGVPSRPYPVEQTDLVFYANGNRFNTVDDSEKKKGQVLPYCSVGGWDNGNAEEQLRDFFNNIVPFAELILGKGNLPYRQIDCYIMY